MEYKVEFINGEYVVFVNVINLEARFDEMDEVTKFIQSMIKNVTSF